MKDDLFNTEKKRLKALADLKGLITTPGWHLLKRVLSLNIEVLEQTILEGDEDMEKDELKKSRLKRYYQKKLTTLPENIIDQLTRSQTEKINLDPYD